MESTLTGDGATLSEKRPFSSSLSAQDAEDIRWYLVDYRIYPVEPTPKIAKRIEQRMSDVGRELFQLVLAGSDVWSAVRGRLADTRIEVETELEDALVPWELMRDPVADLPLALSVPAFVRCHSSPALRPCDGSVGGEDSDPAGDLPAGRRPSRVPLGSAASHSRVE